MKKHMFQNDPKIAICVIFSAHFFKKVSVTAYDCHNLLKALGHIFENDPRTRTEEIDHTMCSFFATVYKAL